jgi:hypothetical protein
MADRRMPRQAPDGQPAPRTRDTEATAKSRVSEVQDPKIAGDAGAKAVDAGGVAVDEAGQVRPKKENLDLLH